MIDPLPQTPGISRREVLKISLCASAFLTTAGVTASLGGCSSSVAANGFSVLRDSDLPFLRALIPVMLDGSLSGWSPEAAVDATLHSADEALAHLSPQMLELTQQLFDVLAMAITRGPLTGIWGSWKNADPADIRHFLHRWENSSLELLRMGHNALLQLVMMAWYSRAESWTQCGYPGPPKV